MALARIEFPGQDGDALAAQLALPAGDRPRPGVLVVHDEPGLEPFVEDAAQRLAAEGFAALAPDLWTREGRAGAAEELPDRRALADLEAGLAWLAGRDDVDPTALAAVGFGAGGTLAFLLACTSRRLAAAVDCGGPLVYPELSRARPIQPLELALNLSCPVLLLFGGADERVPAGHVERIQATLDPFALRYELACWPGAGRRFFNERDPGYHEAASREGRDRTLRFLREELERE